MQEISNKWKKLFAVACCAFVIGGTGSALIAGSGYDGLTVQATGEQHEQEQDIIQGDFQFRTGADDTLTLIRYMGTDRIVEIPSEADERAVTSIGEKAFISCTAMEQVTIPDTVTSIGSRAFAVCRKLRQINIPDNVLSIDKNALGIKNSERIWVKTVYGTSGSAAQTFAEQNELTFVATDVVVPTAVTLNRTSVSLEIGKTFSLTASVEPADATDKTISWNSSNEQAASVSDGIITANAEGTAVITASTSNGITAECTVTVKKPAPKITLDRNIAQLFINETIFLNAAVTSEDPADNNITWYTNNSSVLSVVNNRITALKAGSAVVYAKIPSGKTASCHITVSAKPATMLKLDKTTVSLGLGEAYTYQVTTDGSEKITWTSSNTTVARVTGGTVHTYATGNAIITAKTPNGISAKCIVIVKNAPTSVSLNKTSLSLGTGETFTLSAIIPDGSAAAVRTYTCSNENVVRMLKSNWTAQFVGASTGSATITVSLYNGMQASCQVTVKAAPQTIQLSSDSLSLHVGDTTVLSAILPDDTAAAVITYTTDNPAVLQLTQSDGKAEFTALAEGKATITVTTFNSVQAQCTVEVTNAYKPKIYLSPSNQNGNLYAYGNTNEMEQCNRIADAAKIALERCGFEVKKAPKGQNMYVTIDESNAWGPDLHMPIHTNAGGGHGTLCMVYKSTPESLKYAQPIYNAVQAVTPGTIDYGVRDFPNLSELKMTNGLAVYTEVDFHDNPSIAKWLIEHPTEIGEALCKGVCEAFGMEYIAP